MLHGYDLAVWTEFHIERALRTVKHRIPLDLGQIFHRFPAVGADRKKFCRDFHIFLLRDHFTDHSFVLKGFLTARLTALEQAVIALRVKKPLFVKARLLKAVVNIRGDDKIIFVLYQLQKINTAYKKRIVECIGWKRCVVGISDKS